MLVTKILLFCGAIALLVSIVLYPKILEIIFVLSYISIMYFLLMELITSVYQKKFPVSKTVYIFRNKQPFLYWMLIFTTIVFISGINFYYFLPGLHNFYTLGIK
jgi:hypothetical protein